MNLSYDWQAGLALLAMVIILTRIAKFLTFRVPALEQARQENRELDKTKKAKEKYRTVMKQTQRVGLWSNLAFFFLLAPWFITLELQPIWQIALDIFIILMIYDFFYYLMHRFLFHGEGYFRRVHAVHHQARSPTHIDAHYVHPLETFMGLNLYLLLIPALYPLMGPFHVATIGLGYVIYVNLNVINHCKVDLPYFPFKTLSWITAKHAVHHENMHKGNYATITLFFDKVFGTLD